MPRIKTKGNKLSYKGAVPTVAEVRWNQDGETLCPDCRCPIKETRGDFWCGCDMTLPWVLVPRGEPDQWSGQVYIRMYFRRVIE